MLYAIDNKDRTGQDKDQVYVQNKTGYINLTPEEWASPDIHAAPVVNFSSQIQWLLNVAAQEYDYYYMYMYILGTVFKGIPKFK